MKAKDYDRSCYEVAWRFLSDASRLGERLLYEERHIVELARRIQGMIEDYEDEVWKEDAQRTT